MKRRCLLSQWSVLLLALFFSLGLGGCFSLDPQPDPTRFFTLAPRDFPGNASDLITVEVSQLPYYAQTKRIPVRSGEHEITYLEFSRWTGPLDVMLADRLRERLEPWAADAAAGAWKVEIHVLACEGSRTGEAHFAADYRIWQIGEADPVAQKRFLDTLPWPDESGPAGLVQRLALMADGLGDRIAADLAEGNFPRQPPNPGAAE